MQRGIAAPFRSNENTRMKITPLLPLALLALLATPLSASAQEGKSVVPEQQGKAVDWSLTVTNDYVWRGISQTNQGPALQGSLRYTTPVGVYVGAWTSNVDYGKGDPDHEIDGLIGYKTALGDKVELDVVLGRYFYPGASHLNWTELTSTATLAETYFVAVSYSNDNWATGTDGGHASVGANWALPKDFVISAVVGRSFFNTGTGLKDYTDWSLGLNKTFGPLTLGVAYTGADRHGQHNAGRAELADKRVVITATVSQ